jgi:hypothetical protein
VCTKLDFCQFHVTENVLFSRVSYVAAGFLHSIVSAMEADKSADTRFFKPFFIGWVDKNGKSRAKTVAFWRHLLFSVRHSGEDRDHLTG